jgi:hypothetical protein
MRQEELASLEAHVAKILDASLALRTPVKKNRAYPNDMCWGTLNRPRGFASLTLSFSVSARLGTPGGTHLITDPSIYRHL